MTSSPHSPDDIHALKIRYLAQRKQGDLPKAVDTLRAAIDIDPTANWAHNDLAEILFSHGRIADAENVLRAALRINSTNAQAHTLFGTLLSELNDLPSGEWHFRRALELAGRHAPVLANLALNLMQQGRTDEAETFFSEAHALAPGNFKTLAHWSKLHEVRGDLRKAGELLDQAEAVSSKADVNLLRANHLARTHRPEEALALIEGVTPLSGQGQLERGRLRDRLGRYDEAWTDFVEAKHKLAREAGGVQYKADAVNIFFARLKHFFTRANVSLLPKASRRAEAAQPLFIMGFPRSGTTLIQQVLSSHSAVQAGGELTFLGDLRKVSQLLLPGPEPFPENLAQSWTADHRYIATLFRDYYLARAEQHGLLESGIPFFTDKMPFNEIYAPLLRMAFPEAKVIRVVRDPLDVCVSMMSNNLTHGFNCAYRVEDIVRHLTAVHELVEHYHRELGTEEYVLRYETFVEHPIEETRRLLEYVDLPFEEACLSFHENPRYAPTPSYAQVAERLNDRSIGRHRHYSRQLSPFLTQLQNLKRAPAK